MSNSIQLNLFNILNYENYYHVTSLLYENIHNNILSWLTIFFIFINFFFKITAAPFHFWAPSVYGKGPIASVTFLSIFFKVVIFFLMFKLLYTIFHSFHKTISPILFFFGILSICFGILGAFSEKILKRFFVYSSMGHVGFMLVALSVFSLNGASASFHYLFIYILTSFLLWYVLFFLGSNKSHLSDLGVLKNSQPSLGFLFTLIGFSMSGIPPLAGFFIKFNVFCSLYEKSQIIGFAFLLILTLPAFFYYLRVLKIIWFDGSSLYNNEHDLSLTLQTSDKIDFEEEGENLAFSYTYLAFPIIFYVFFVKLPLTQLQAEMLFSLFS